MKKNKVFNGFSKLNHQERLAKLITMGFLSSDDLTVLNQILPLELAEKLIENVISCYALPLGVAVNFVIDAREYVVPMVTEETSIVAAASKTAKWIKEKGEITTEIIGREAIGQIQIAQVKNFPRLENALAIHKKQIIDELNQGIAKRMHMRGGGVTNIVLRKIPRTDNQLMAVIHVLIDTCDAMGANVINQICEYLRPVLEELTDETTNMAILSNLVDGKLVRASIKLHEVDSVTGNAIEEASLFAEHDPYRAATNNKGVLNGIDSVVMATGNDWRAVEAGIHAFAAQQGHYSSVTRWRYQKKELVGEITAPINVGIYGGITRIHPLAEFSLKLLGVQSAGELSRIIAAVGLVQNLGALRALTTEGICRGHMRLHLKNICLAVGAANEEIPALEKTLSQLYENNKSIGETEARAELQRMRQRKMEGA